VYGAPKVHRIYTSYLLDFNWITFSLLCSLQFGAGWFSDHMLNCLRQRLMVRFLSIFPKPGAENLLRAASEKFEKLKKGRIKGALKPGEESPLANAGIN
jgi:hypothetical protein